MEPVSESAKRNRLHRVGDVGRPGPAAVGLERRNIMMLTSWKKFQHPAGVYRLEYPSHWDQVQQDEGRSCGFGPHDRDDVGLWISIMPMSIDTDRLAEDLPRLMKEAMCKVEAGEPRLDKTLHHHALVAEVRKEGEGGH